MERRYLVVPGLRSSRIHIIDTKPDPLSPKVVKVIEAEEIASKMTYMELSVSPGFMNEYMSALFLPHTNLEAFPTVKKEMEERKK